MIDKYVDKLKDDIIHTTQELVKVPSVYSESSDSSTPFGWQCHNVLSYFLHIAEELGFKTKNIDGYCGYVEFGSGEDLIGIIGHLDVVPEGDNWTYPPYSATIADNKIYGRGTIDDKGPVVAALYAMKVIKDNFRIYKRCRLIVGINEENDSLCMKHYKESGEEIPSISFSPDASFPCIYAEKGILNSFISSRYSFRNHQHDAIFIKEINTDSEALNVVHSYCDIILGFDSFNKKGENIVEFVNSIANDFNFNVTCELMDKDSIKIISKGVQAHASHPDLGVNAISQLLMVLFTMFKKYESNCDLLNFFNRFIGLNYNGKNLIELFNKDISDESGDLTLNIGSFSYKNDLLTIGLDLRIPIKTKISFIEDILKKKCSYYNNLSYNTDSFEDSLYVPKYSFLVQTLTRIFNKENNSDFEPIAIGGGTYAREFPNCVSFGPNFPGDIDMCHQSDEFIDIDKLISCSKMYAKAILSL